MNRGLDTIRKQTRKDIKKVFYRSRMHGFKLLVCLMLAGALVSSGLYALRYVYINYAVSRARISLTYPEITFSQYPDGSRFTYYDFIAPERLKEALVIMQDHGAYMHLTVDDIKDNFYVYSYMDGSVADTVSEVRSGGNDFSYVANEYKITFVQPHSHEGETFWERCFEQDRSSAFLRVLMQVNHAVIAREHSGANGFRSVVAFDDGSAYDYSERVDVYKNKIGAAVNYLSQLGRESSNDFISEKYDRTLQDLIGEYKILNSNKLDSISSFIDASGLCVDSEVATNKLNVNIESNTVKYLKYSDAFFINSYAQSAYDHTFTENLIVVTHDDNDGLYQARPKTAFDTVVTQKHEAKQNAVERQEKIRDLSADVALFGTVSGDPDEYGRLCDKCDELFTDFDAEYRALSEKAAKVVQQYLDEINEGYLHVQVEKKNIVSKEFLMKLAFVFCVGAVMVFIAYSTAVSIRDGRRQKAKARRLKRLREEKMAERGI